DSSVLGGPAELSPFRRAHVRFTPAGPAFVAEPLERVEAVAEGKLVGQASRGVTVRLVADPDSHLIHDSPGPYRDQSNLDRCLPRTAHPNPANPQANLIGPSLPPQDQSSC